MFSVPWNLIARGLLEFQTWFFGLMWFQNMLQYMQMLSFAILLSPLCNLQYCRVLQPCKWILYYNFSCLMPLLVCYSRWDFFCEIVNSVTFQVEGEVSSLLTPFPWILYYGIAGWPRYRHSLLAGGYSSSLRLDYSLTPGIKCTGAWAWTGKKFFFLKASQEE